MRNLSLGQDYLLRASHRLAAIAVLHERESWADVVRESQEVVELALKGLLRLIDINPPRVHDVSDVLIEEKDRLPAALQNHVEALANISRALRRDRELAFYGTEDLTPSEFYRKNDADEAFTKATWVVDVIRQHDT